MADVTPVISNLARYVPRVSAEWDLHTSELWQEIEGSLCYIDISGFTALSEKLARRGRIGAEELTDVLNHVFGKMLGVAYDRGGSLLKFGGDALLLAFRGPDHPIQACSAAVEMQAVLRDARTYKTSAGRLHLKMSVGLHSGTVHLFRVGESHKELILTGPAASLTTEMEETAAAGEVLISSSTKAALPPGSVTKAKGDGWLLSWRKARIERVGWIPRIPLEPEAIAVGMPVALRDYLHYGAAEPEHHIATVGFIKYQGVDALMASGGPSAVAEALDDLIRNVQEVVDQEGVTFLASDIDQDGGKIILVAGVPGVQEDDEGRVLRAARRIADRAGALTLRIGVNQGHVFVGEIGTDFRATYTIMGDTVNLAARLMAAASPGEVYASPAVLDGSLTLFATTPLEPFYVKGKEHPVQAYAVGAETGSRPSQRGRELPFTGRTDELAELNAALARLNDGTGGVVSIIGERGIGKSRLVDEALPLAEDMHHISIRSEPYGTASPYRPFRDPVRRLLGIERAENERMAKQLEATVTDVYPDALPFLPLLAEVAMVEVAATPETAAIDPRFRRDRTADVIIDLLTHVLHGPVLFEIEDGHWTDDASAHLLGRIAGLTHKQPWLVLTTRRDQPGGFQPKALLISLRPLADEESRELIVRATAAAPLRPHDIDAIISRAGGVPLFIEEIVRAIRTAGDVASLPDSLDAVVSAQIDGLQPLARRLLRYSSVLGRSFRTEVLDYLIADEDLALDEAARHQLTGFLDDDGEGRLMFRHAMLRDVAYQGLSFKRRQELHRRAGEVIEQNAGANPEAVADILALHYSLAGELEKTWTYARLAGDAAHEAYANVEAAEQYERALSVGNRIGAPGAAERARVWAMLGFAREESGLFGEALDAFKKASSLTEDVLGRASLLRQRARARERAGSYSAALRELATARRLLSDDDSAEAAVIRADLIAFAASVRQAQERPRDALADAQKAAQEARAVDAKLALARAYEVMDWAHFVLGEPDKAVHGLEALALLEELGMLDAAASVTNNLGAIAYFDGRWDDALDYFNRAKVDFGRAGNAVQEAVAGSNVGEILVSQGRLDEAEPMLRESDRVMRASGFDEGAAFADIHLARMLAERGELDEAEALLTTTRDELAEIGRKGTALEAAIYLAECRIRRGEASEALAILEAAVEAAPDEFVMHLANLSRVRSAAFALLMRFDEARAALEEGMANAQAYGLVFERALLLMARTALATASNEEPDPADVSEAGQLLSGLGVQRLPTWASQLPT